MYLEDNKLVAKSPFGKSTNQWIDKCLKKGRNVSDELDLQVNSVKIDSVKLLIVVMDILCR